MTVPSKTGYKWKAAYAKFIGRGKTPAQAAKMAGMTTPHVKKRGK